MSRSYDDTLNAVIREAQIIADQILELQPFLPEAAVELPALVSELYAIVTCLRCLQLDTNHPPNLQDVIFYSDVIRDTLQAISRTLKDLDYYLSNKDRLTGRSRRESPRLIWEDLNEFFIRQSGNTLHDRLRHFKRFLREFSTILAGQGETREFNLLYENIDVLLSIQDSSIERSRQLRLDSIYPPIRVKSWERRRPGPLEDLLPRIRPVRGTLRRSVSPLPLRPISPSTDTIGSSTTSPLSSVGSEMANHWLRTAFAQNRPTTNFHKTGTESVMFDEHMSGATAALRKTNYFDLLALPFDKVLELRVFYRETDQKARLYCKSDLRGNKVVACRPVSSLHIYRKESNLLLCRLDKKKKPMHWVNLRFLSYERLILFFCAFLALKNIDNSMIGHKLDGHVLQGEVHVFSCVIVDGHYRHALQIYKDTCSDGIRLQASVLKGELQRTPVWTAFINYKISSWSWVKRHEANKIHLGDLPRYIFLADYKPHCGLNGEHELHFERSRDADEFEQVIEDLAGGVH